ncbi:MAG: hypothetical protein V3U78_06385 [Thiotrichaceae bacterium]
MLKVLSFLVTSLGFLSACSHTTSHTASNQGMVCIAPNIYVDSEMSAQQRQQFLQTVKQSKAEISHFFGGMKSSPDIYACTTKPCFSKFGGVPAKAKSIDDKKVLLSSRGLDKTTLTHELAHIELHKRLGSRKVWNKIPMWFDEGLAVMACKDTRYAKSVPMMPLSELVSQDQWVSAVRSNKPAYSVAKQAVEAWYNNAGAKGLKLMVTRMQQGQSFSQGSRLNAKVQVTGL